MRDNPDCLTWYRLVWLDARQELEGVGVRPHIFSGQAGWQCPCQYWRWAVYYADTLWLVWGGVRPTTARLLEHAPWCRRVWVELGCPISVVHLSVVCRLSTSSVSQTVWIRDRRVSLASSFIDFLLSFIDLKITSASPRVESTVLFSSAASEFQRISEEWFGRCVLVVVSQSNINIYVRK